jgi:hypothetical protein
MWITFPLLYVSERRGILHAQIALSELPPMRRCVVLPAIAFAALLASRADAIEMFTNFNNGTNVGFPPMEVPVGIYRGFGRGGWNPHAEGMYFRSNPPVPAMMPTGQLPRTMIRVSGESNKKFSSLETSSDVQYVADRRRGGRWQRTPNSSSSAPSNNTLNPTPSTPSSGVIRNGNGPTPAKAPESGETGSTDAPAKSNKAQRSVTVLRAQSGKSSSSATPTAGADATRDGDFSPQSSSALFPNSSN